MAAEKWDIDTKHSGVNFSVRHLLVAKVRGKFGRFSGTILTEGGDLTHGKVDIVIDASSIETGVADRDAHLRSADFFDVAKYPELTFHSKRVDQGSGDLLKLVGDLTMHGVTQEVTLEVEPGGRTKDPYGFDRAGFTAKARIQRKDFGLVWNQILEAGGVAVSDHVDLEIEVAVTHKAA